MQVDGQPRAGCATGYDLAVTSLLVATTNLHKLEEYRELLADLPLRLLGLADVAITQDVDETGDTFEENARLKAERYAELSGLLTLADDSGLEVDALGGQPGVHSRRWAGDVTDAQRNAALLARLLMVPDALRTGRFRCAIAVAEPGRDTVVVEGRCEGHIAWQPRGEHGFGYDPLFQPKALQQTLGEVPAEVKNRLSHRAQAACAARDLLRQRLAR